MNYIVYILYYNTSYTIYGITGISILYTIWKYQLYHNILKLSLYLIENKMYKKYNS